MRNTADGRTTASTFTWLLATRPQDPTQYLCTVNGRLCTSSAWTLFVLTYFETKTVRQVSELLRLHGLLAGEIGLSSRFCAL
jgi:hypothetical protein